jgi:hypothetical protein
LGKKNLKQTIKEIMDKAYKEEPDTIGPLRYRPRDFEEIRFVQNQNGFPKGVCPGGRKTLITNTR